jgi:hypothetical protein
MPVLRQSTSFGPGIYRGHKFDIDRLKKFADGTNRAIAAGVPIPLLIKKHAPINASDEDTAKEAEVQGGGWLKALDVDEKGNLAWEAEVTESTKAGVDSGELKYTSPEFRDHYVCEKEGTYEGPVVRHITFTPLPGNPHQSPIETIALTEMGVFQFGEADKEADLEVVTSKDVGNVEDVVALAEQPQNPTLKKIPEATDDPADVEIIPDVAEESPPTEQKNPDMPPKATDRTKLAAVLAGLAQKGIILPSDFDFESEAALDILLAGLNSSIKAEQEAEAQEKPEEESPPVQEASMPFSEEDKAREPYLASPKHHKNLIKKGFKYRASSAGGWDHHYEHEDGREATVSFQHSNDTHGKLSISQHGEVVEEEVQFSEEELAALPPKARQAIEAGVKALAAEKIAKEEAEQAKQFAEEDARKAKNNLARDKSVRTINAAKIPPAMREALVLNYTTMQFNEGVEPTVYTPAQVAELFAKFIPPSLQFIESEVKEAEEPLGADGKPVAQFFEHGEVPAGHVSPEKAMEIIAEKYGPVTPSHANGPFKATSSVSQYVEEQNKLHPNDLMRT